ncbi:MAG: RDD family protein [Halobacteriaceae archaeon]
MERPDGPRTELYLRRGVAAAIDAVVAVAVGVVVTGLAGGMGSLGTGVAAGTGAVLGYYVYFEGRRGQTVGKLVLGLGVVRMNGRPCGFRRSLIRNLIRPIDFLPAGYAVGLASMVATEYDRRLGDLAAGTVVVRVRRD